jgi:hypothetical protein
MKESYCTFVIRIAAEQNEIDDPEKEIALSDSISNFEELLRTFLDKNLPKKFSYGLFD